MIVQTSPDWAPIVNAILSGVGLVLGLVITALVTRYVPRALDALEARTGIQVNDQERAAVYASARTATGILETQLDQGLLKLEHVTPENEAVIDQAKAAILRVPDAAKSQSTTAEAMAAIVVGMVDTTAHPPPSIMPVAFAGGMPAKA